GGQFLAVLTEHAHIVARDRLGAGARLHRQHPQPDAVHPDGPAGLRLPPVVDHRNAELPLRPVQRVRVAALASEEKSAEGAQVVAPDVLAGGIVAPDGRRYLAPPLSACPSCRTYRGCTADRSQPPARMQRAVPRL